MTLTRPQLLALLAAGDADGVDDRAATPACWPGSSLSPTTPIPTSRSSRPSGGRGTYDRLRRVRHDEVGPGRGGRHVRSHRGWHGDQVATGRCCRRHCLLSAAHGRSRPRAKRDSSDPAAAGDWLTDGGRRKAVVVALNLLPFAGIAFLWFIGVVRDRIGEGEDRFFATVFLGSGLLFVAMMMSAPRSPVASCSPPTTAPSPRPNRASGPSVAESPTPS